LSHGDLGLALVGLSLGTVVAMLASGRLVVRLGAGRVTWWSVLALCAAAPAPALAGSLATLAAALGLLGLVNGLATVAANAEAAAVEADAGVSMMVSFHAMFSIGGVAGAAAGSLAAAGLGPLAHLLLLGSAGALAVLSRRGTLGPAPPVPPDTAAAPVIALPRGPLLGLALVCFATMLGEGAASDWSAVLLARELGAGQLAAGLGYVLFAAGMTAGRLRGDALCRRFGEVAVVRGGALFAAAGLGLGLALGHPLAAALGFACLGLGLAGIVPIAIRRAAAVPGLAPGVGVAAVACLGFTGFLAGPPLIGLLAEGAVLAAALGIVPVLALGVVLAAGRVLRAASPAAATSGVAESAS
jgi:hypothetical protein